MRNFWKPLSLMLFQRLIGFIVSTRKLDKQIKNSVRI
nr:MAG TPA: hypothetical protein [Caudoviricetes sp.]